MRGRNHGLACSVPLPDHLLLDKRNFLRRELNAHIAPRDHEPVRDFKNGIEVVYALFVLDFCDDRYIPAARLKAFAYGQHVSSGAHKRGRNQVYAVHNAKAQVRFVLR
ncbi:MAG: hypothetical protein DDT39_01724 [Firmicutes bacterium]|nr:hypothetical protein [candidate division NPL-UPA2 bacterium]